MLSKIWQLIPSLLDLGARLISPPFCEQCQRFISQRQLLCNDCIQTILPVVSVNLSLGRRGQLTVYAAGAYQAPLQGLVLGKQRGYYLASRYLAEQIYERTPFPKLPCDYLIPIPLHWSRELKRGYNQSMVIAQRLAQLRTDVALETPLRRSKRTQPQSNLSKSERAINLEAAFELGDHVDLELYRDKDLILVDDVLTSGATLINAAQELLKLRPRSISAVVACRAI